MSVAMPSTNVAEPEPMPLAVSETIVCAESIVLSTICCEPSIAPLKVLQAVKINADSTSKYFIFISFEVVELLIFYVIVEGL